MSRTRQARLAQELRVLRELKTQLEKARQQGQKELPAWVQEDERFRLLLRQAEKQVNLPPSVQASRGASVHVVKSVSVSSFALNVQMKQIILQRALSFFFYCHSIVVPLE